MRKSIRTIRRYLSTGKFPNAVKDNAGRVVIPTTDIIRFETGQPPQQQITPELLTGNTSQDDRDVPKPTPEETTHAGTPVEDRNGRDDDTRQDIVKSDIRFLLQIDLSFFRFLIVRKAGDPSLIRDVATAMGTAWHRLFKK